MPRGNLSTFGRAMRAGTIMPIAVLVLVACGGTPQTPKIDPDSPDLTVKRAMEIVNAARHSAGNRESKYAPEMLLAAEYYLRRADAAIAGGDEHLAVAKLAKAEWYYANAVNTTLQLTKKRTLRFPENRSIGEISTKPWSGGQWRRLGPAQGNLEIPADTMVQLGVSPDFTSTDIEILAGNGPGAVQYLSLGGVRVTGEIVSCLEKLVGLREVSLYQSGIRDEHMELLAQVKTLRRLNLMGNQITDAGITPLSSMPALEELALGDTLVTDKCLLAVRTIPGLRRLVFRNVELSDVGLDYLRQAASLEELWISGRQITDYGLPLFAELPRLKELVLLQTSISIEGAETLKRALPGCTISHMS